MSQGTGDQTGRLHAPGLDDLHLFNADPDGDPLVPMFDFVQDGLTPGGTVKRRQIAESAYMDDAFQVQSSKARIPASFGFFVTGRSHNNLQTNIHDLIHMVNQPHWHLHVRFDGADAHYAWRCWDAEVTVGFPTATWYGLWAPVTVATLRSPHPVSGPI